MDESRATCDGLRELTVVRRGHGRPGHDLHLGALERSHAPAGLRTPVPSGLRLVAAMHALPD